MPTIAVVDDRIDDRDTLERLIGTTLKQVDSSKCWHVKSTGPPPKERDLLTWLDEHDAPVLVTDWRLNDGSVSEGVVTYEANDLIDEIRKRRPDFPIFVVTAFEPEARPHLASVEGVLSRDDFSANPRIYVQQIIRAGNRRLESQRSSLERMDELARRIATGNATAADRKELKGLQGLFQAELVPLVNLDGVLKEFEKLKPRVEALQQRVDARLKKLGKKK